MKLINDHEGLRNESVKAQRHEGIIETKEMTTGFMDESPESAGTLTKSARHLFPNLKDMSSSKKMKCK